MNNYLITNEILLFLFQSIMNDCFSKWRSHMILVLELCSTGRYFTQTSSTFALTQVTNKKFYYLIIVKSSLNTDP